MRYNASASPFGGLPTVVKNLLIINGIVFLIQLLWSNGGNRVVEDRFALHYFASPDFKPWQLVTHMFMHGGFGHLALNMLGLFMFGPPLEYKWGSKRFLSFYILSGIGAALFYSGAHAIEYFQLLERMDPETVAMVRREGGALWASGRTYSDADAGALNQLLNMPMLGASGALYGILLAFGLTFPNVELMMLYFPVPIRAKYFVFIMAGLSIFMAMRDNPTDNVAHLAHLGGMVVGYILMKAWDARTGTRSF